MSAPNPQKPGAEAEAQTSPRESCRHCGTAWSPSETTHQCVGSVIGELMESERVSSLNLAAAERCAGERDHLRAQLAEAGRERDAAKLEASKTALLRTMLHNHFCTVLGWEKVREMEGNPYMLANAVSHEVWRCKNRELDFTLLTNERDAAQARVGEMEDLLQSIRDRLDDDAEDDAPDWYHLTVRRIDAALATSPHRLAGRGSES